MGSPEVSSSAVATGIDGNVGAGSGESRATVSGATTAAAKIVVPVVQVASILVWRIIWTVICLFCRCAQEVFQLARDSLVGDGANRELKPPDNATTSAEVANVGVEESPAVQESTGEGSAHSEPSRMDEEEGVAIADAEAASAADQEIVLETLVLCVAAGTASNLMATILGEAVVEVQASGEHSRVRFAVQADREPFRIVVLGPCGAVRGACKALISATPGLEKEAQFPDLFMLHLTLREAWDLPQEDDELVDASLSRDWVDLGAAVAETANTETPAGEQAAGDNSPGTPSVATTISPPRSPRTVLRGRLREALLASCDDLHVFMDDNPFASWGRGDVRVDLAGPLRPDVWEEALKAVLSCEALGVYLSRRYDAVFRCPDEFRSSLQDQVASAMCHFKGTHIQLGNDAFGLEAGLFTGFEDLAANVLAVLRGEKPPGWHRLEWTPHGAGAVPHMTY